LLTRVWLVYPTGLLTWKIAITSQLSAILEIVGLTNGRNQRAGIINGVMSQDYLARIAALEDALRQKDSQLSLVAETESFLRSALARAEEKIENEACETGRVRVIRIFHELR
jgi:DNA-binding transcriptional regulator of glucitol operon